MTAPTSPQVEVLPTADAAIPILLGELRAALVRRPRPLIGFATGGTFTAFFAALAAEFAAQRLRGSDFVATHLDEYAGFDAARRGGMVHELVTHCAGFGEMLRSGAFLPVPGSEAGLAAHEAAIAACGGVELQFLGIGRNGHIAFNEPGTPFERGFHATTLAASTRDDARPRFLPEEPPRQAITSGIATILAARRVVLCAFGRGKAPAVAAMLRGAVNATCPASAIRRHANAVVLLDNEAAGDLRAQASAQS